MSRSCLVVDDNLTNRLVARYIMEDLGFTVTEAVSAEEASTCLDRDSFDLVLLDWMMPGMDGIDFLTTLRQHPMHAGARVVMCSAKAGDAHMEAALAAGANAYLPKPITFDDTQRMLAAIGVQ